MSEKSSARATVQSQIDKNKVVVYSKSYCPYCAETKKLLQEMEVNFLLVELDQLENGDELQDALAEITGQRTVPNIFIRGKSVGGNSDLKALHKKGTNKKIVVTPREEPEAIEQVVVMLPALSTKPKQAVRQVKGLTNDSIDAYSNTPMGGGSNAMTSYADNTTDSNSGSMTARASPPSTSKPSGSSGRSTARKGHGGDEGSGNGGGGEAGGGLLARVMRDRKASGDEELGLKAGDVVRVLSTKRTGYLKCEFADEVGYVPSSYLEFFDESNGGGAATGDADTVEENQRAEKRKKKKEKRHHKDKKLADAGSDPEDSSTLVAARSPRKGGGGDHDAGGAAATGDEGEPSPRKSKKKNHKESGKSNKHHHHRHGGEDEDAVPDTTLEKTKRGVGDDTERRKAKKQHKKKRHHHDSSDASSESDDDEGSRHRKGKRRHRSRRRGRGRGSANSDSESSSSYYSSSDSGYHSRHHRRHHHRKASSSDEDDYDTGDKHKAHHRSRHRGGRGSGGSDAEDIDSAPRSSRRSDKKRLDAESTPRGGGGGKSGKDREKESYTTGAAVANSSRIEKEVAKLNVQSNGNGNKASSQSSELISDHTPEQESTKTGASGTANGASTSSKNEDSKTKSSRSKKDDESRTESTVAAQKAKTNLGKQIGEKMRSLLGGGKKTERSHKSSSGILNACPGTTQGEEGWYEHGENERYYFVLLDGKWSLLYGPMTEEDFELYSNKVLDQNRMIELPPTYLHKAGYFLNQELRVQKV